MSRIGIAGFGVVGKSILNYLKSDDCCYKTRQLSLWDKRALSSEELSLLKQYKIFEVYSFKVSLENFLKLNDLNIISPGISPKFYASFCKGNCVGELDIFSSVFHKPTVAVTGTLGKTTITKLISILLSKLSKLQIGTGGNIGKPMLDLVKLQNPIDFAVLELSSFQLYLNNNFAPDIAIWNNFYSNHLDWHQSLEEYFDSKFKIAQFQKPGQSALFSFDLLKCFKKQDFIVKLQKIKSNVCFVCDKVIDLKELSQTLNLDGYSVFYPCNNYLFHAQILKKKLIVNQKIFDLACLPDFSFVQNWLFVVSALFLFSSSTKELEVFLKNLDLMDFKKKLGDVVCEHRLELFATINGVDFYNDSKSTVVQATQNALCQLDKKDRPIILIFGGLGKGVNRSNFISSLSEQYKNLKEVFCFGAESFLFKEYMSYPTIESVLNATLSIVEPGDQVLFSPGGSSFDLFDNYKHRGKVFKELVFRRHNRI